MFLSEKPDQYLYSETTGNHSLLCLRPFPQNHPWLHLKHCSEKGPLVVEKDIHRIYLRQCTVYRE